MVRPSEPRDVVSSRTESTTTNFEEALGRLMYVAGALEHERPLLSPLYSFLALHPWGVVRKVPGLREVLPAVLFTSSLTVQAPVATLWKQHVWLTHRPARTEQGLAVGHQNLTKMDAPIAGSPGGTVLRSRELSVRGSSSAVRNQARILSTIEALAALMGLNLFYEDDTQIAPARIQMIPSFH